MQKIAKLVPFALVSIVLGAGCSSTPSSNTPDGSSTGTADTSSPASSSSPSSGSSGSSDSGSSDDGTTEGKHAVEVTAAYVTGAGPRSIGDAKGKVVILDFWGTYCGPCKASFPKYQALLDQYGKDLAIIAVSEDETDSAKEDDLKKFAKDRGAKFVILWDKNKAAAKKYNPGTMPTSFVIDKDGKIVHIHTGFKDDEEKKISAEIKDLLK